MTSSTSGYTALIDYYIHRDGTATFHGVDYSPQKKRICHRTFVVTGIPFVVHMGPFNSQADCTYIKDQVASYYSGKMPELPLGETRLHAICHEANDHTWRGVPIAYLSNPMNPARHWLEMTVFYNDGEGRAGFSYSQHHSLLRTFCKQLLASDPKKYANAKWWQTDRHSQDSLLRLMAPYIIPGVFMVQHSPRPTAAEISTDADITTLNWTSFESRILAFQADSEIDALTLERGKGSHNTHDDRYDAKILVAVTSVSLYDVIFYELNMHTGACVRKMKKSVASYNSHDEIKLLKKSCLCPDLLLVGIQQDVIDQVHAKLTRDALSKGKTEAFISLIGSHCDIITNAKKMKLLRDDVPCDTMLYRHCPYLVTPHYEKLKDMEYIYDFVSQLFTKARITGRTLGFLSAPLGYSALSRRAEGIITRTLLRDGYTVLPVSSHATYTRDDEDDKDNLEDEDMIDVILEGGINAEVQEQFVCPPNMVINIDFSSFYGAIMCIFQLDPCNTALWMTYDLELRKLVKDRQDPAPTVADNLPNKVDISPIGDIWYKETIGDGPVVTPASERKPTAASQTNNLPLTTYIQKCLLMRRALQAELEHSFTSSGKGRATTKALIDFLKSIVSAAYGAISYANNRFNLLPLAALVTQYGRRIIRESSARMKTLMPKSATEIMCVTDSLAFRFAIAELPPMLAAIGTLKQSYIQHFYGDILQLTTTQITRLLMTKRNHYAYIEKSKEDKIVIKGFSPRHKDTPRYIVLALEAILINFMKNYAMNLWPEATRSHTFIASRDQEKLIRVLETSVAAACTQNLLHMDPPGFSAIVQDKTLANYFVKLSEGDAQRRHFLYDEKAKKNRLVETLITLKIVKGCVVDYDEMQGFIVSPIQEISQKAWDAYYLDYSIRKELITILQTFFPAIAIDEAICNVLIGLERLATWQGRNVAIHPSYQNPQAGMVTPANAASLQPKVANGYWEQVATMAYGEGGNREHEVILLEQERIAEGDAEEEEQVVPQPLSPTSSHSDDADLYGNVADEELLEMDMGDSEAAIVRGKKKPKRPKKPKALKPIKVVHTGDIPEFEWKFELSCVTCRKSTRSSSIRMATDYICCHCGHSIFGDFMQVENSATATLEPPPSIRLECYRRGTDEEFDFMSRQHSFFDTRCNWRSLEALKYTLLGACLQETSYVPTGKDDSAVGNGDNADTSEAPLLLPADLQTRALFINFGSLDGDFEDQPTTNLKYLALVFKHLNTHPYLRAIGQ